MTPTKQSPAKPEISTNAEIESITDLPNYTPSFAGLDSSAGITPSDINSPQKKLAKPEPQGSIQEVYAIIYNAARGYLARKKQRKQYKPQAQFVEAQVVSPMEANKVQLEERNRSIEEGEMGHDALYENMPSGSVDIPDLIIQQTDEFNSSSWSSKNGDCIEPPDLLPIAIDSDASPILQIVEDDKAQENRIFLYSEENIAVCRVFLGYLGRKQCKILQARQQFLGRQNFAPEKKETDKPEISTQASEVEASLGEFPCQMPSDSVVVEIRDSCITSKGEWYSGTWSKSNLRHGTGKAVYPDGSTYQGTWKNDEPNENGRIIHSDGSYYIGEFIAGQKSGQGEIVYSNGTTYNGEWKSNKPHGQGEEEKITGEVYNGTFKAGIRTGQGKLVLLDSTEYTGEFLDGKYEGFGCIKYPDGSSYTGNWHKGERYGQGEMTYIEGKKYIGTFVDGKEHGTGELDGRKGEWIAGEHSKWL